MTPARPAQHGITISPQTLLLVAALIAPAVGVATFYVALASRVQGVEAATARGIQATEQQEEQLERIDRNVGWLCAERDRDNQQAGRTQQSGCR